MDQAQLTMEVSVRILLAIAAILFVGSLAAACAFWAGASVGAPIALALAGFVVAIVVPLTIAQLGNWGVPGDEPRVTWRNGSPGGTR
jgi:hypothetical protein